MNVEALDGFVSGCMAHGLPYRESRVTRTLERVSDCDCPTCTDWVATGVQAWLGGDRTDLVCSLLGFCGCGDPGAVEQQFCDYLEGLAGWWAEVDSTDDDGPGFSPLRLDLPPRPEFDYLTAYLCDALGWTEHGGSVGGAWLTEDGEKALANLRANVTSEDKP